jgi:hypothetical protein
MNIISNYIRCEYQYFRKWDDPLGARLRASAVIGFFSTSATVFNVDVLLREIRGSRLELTEYQRLGCILVPWLLYSSLVWFSNKENFSDDWLPRELVNRGLTMRCVLLGGIFWGLIKM